MACLDWGKEMVNIAGWLKEMEEGKAPTKRFLTELHQDLKIFQYFFQETHQLFREDDLVVLRSISQFMKWIIKHIPAKKDVGKRRKIH